MSESRDNKPRQTPSASTPGPQLWKPADADKAAAERPKEIGGRKGPEPTRYGDWEKNGRCIDF